MNLLCYRTVILTCILTVSSLLAWAQPGPGGPGPLMPRIETLDTNGDGQVSTDEFSTGWAKAISDQFDKLDADRSGTLSKEELPKPPDGPPPGHGPQENSSNGHRPPMPPGPPPDGAGSRARPPRPEDLDANQDGNVTREEFTAGWTRFAQEQFTGLDANRDGVLSKEELSKMRGPRPGGAGAPPSPPNGR